MPGPVPPPVTPTPRSRACHLRRRCRRLATDESMFDDLDFDADMLVNLDELEGTDDASGRDDWASAALSSAWPPRMRTATATAMTATTSWSKATAATTTPTRRCTPRTAATSVGSACAATSTAAWAVAAGSARRRCVAFEGGLRVAVVARTLGNSSP